jgi:tetratricopeptide (TPR) repeat protein
LPASGSANERQRATRARVFDLHDEAYYVWRDLGVRGAVLVHVDGHHDAEAAVPSGLIGIGNYVRAAFDDGMVAHVHWVVPDPLWDNAERHALVQRVLEETAPLPICAAPLRELAGFASPVLLDVDVDYFFTIGYGRDPSGLRLPQPWAEPADLAAVLNIRCPLRIATTVATSITGCFTAVEWKHFGEATAALLDGRPCGGRIGEAAAAYRDAVRLQAAGERDAARAAFAHAVACDPEYRHPFRTPGHVYRHIGRPAEARANFESALELDPEDDWARLGLAMLAAADGRPREALERLPGQPPDPGALDWWRTRGVALDALGDVAGAIEAYSRALTLATAGAVPLHMRTSNRDRRLVDPRHWDDHAALAALYARAGNATLARVHEVMARAALGRRPNGVVGS